MNKNNKHKIYIIIPAFNEGKVISSVLNSLKKNNFRDVIIIDDGSTDDTYEIAKRSGFVVLRHLINRGKGAATQTGLDAARLLGADVAVTMDADEQHSADDLNAMITPITQNKADVTLGSRFIIRNPIPKSKILVNKIANLVTFAFYGIYVTDSQSGFRGYSKKAINLIQTDMDRYEFESQVLHQIKHYHLKYVEVPISVQYNKYSKEKYKDIKDFQPQNFKNGIKMLIKMVIRSILS